ncbi:MAG: helix-turn-helix domain-containing protein [Betaproteobacteria bacterium]|nr:helix-turn-helix domain-containing protein [Betaproteobacteria bacterium]
MPQECVASGPDASSLAEIKQMSGRRIEYERRRIGLTQSQLAARVDLGVSWIREIESGNPKTRIDDHLRCAAALALSPSHIFIPLLFMAHGLTFAPQLLAGNLYELERHWLQFIIDHNIADMRRILLGDRGDGTGSAFPQLGT